MYVEKYEFVLVKNKKKVIGGWSQNTTSLLSLVDTTFSCRRSQSKLCQIQVEFYPGNTNPFPCNNKLLDGRV